MGLTINKNQIDEEKLQKSKIESKEYLEQQEKKTQLELQEQKENTFYRNDDFGYQYLQEVKQWKSRQEQIEFANQQYTKINQKEKVNIQEQKKNTFQTGEDLDYFLDEAKQWNKRQEQIQIIQQYEIIYILQRQQFQHNVYEQNQMNLHGQNQRSSQQSQIIHIESNRIENTNNQESDQFFTMIQGSSPIFPLELTQTQNYQSDQLVKESIIDKLPKQLKELYDQYGPYKPPDQQIQFDLEPVLINLNDKSYYFGKMQNNMKEGYGYHLTDSEFYEGNFENNERKGWGRVINQLGYKIGYWQDDQIQKEMEIKQENYSYKGQCQDSIPHGYGELDKPDYIYKGFFHYGKRQGKGINELKSHQERYEGEFFDDKFHGQGIQYQTNGKKYQGNFKNNKWDGLGELHWPSPENKYYKGNFVNGQREGQGYFRDSDNSEYDGQWENDKKNGLGKFIKGGIEISGKWKDEVLLEDENQ
ncbi:unnamed protein product [Paramecium sonneborni]|uniref:Uncharacterized protein n=1 Tax=Paramecium sonneborni TaxID=65129 RepID=A0A8S1KBI3_9CILI|nr:unnamed protein product [Paramecium sonneborni]